MNKYLTCLFLIFCIQCDIDHQKLLLINNTNDTIYYRLLTDTVFNEDLYLYELIPYDSVRPFFAKGGEGAWEFKINNLSIDSTLYVYLFYNSPINTEVIKKRLYSRMDFKVKDLDKLDWIVTID